MPSFAGQHPDPTLIICPILHQFYYGSSDPYSYTYFSTYILSGLLHLQSQTSHPDIFPISLQAWLISPGKQTEQQTLHYIYKFWSKPVCREKRKVETKANYIVKEKKGCTYLHLPASSRRKQSIVSIQHFPKLRIEEWSLIHQTSQPPKQASFPLMGYSKASPAFHEI